jgi:hypothetical protein
MRRAALLLLSLLTAAGLGAGCNRRSPTQPTQAISEQFAGTLTQQGTNAHPFTVNEGGPVTITVLSVARETPAPPEDTPPPNTSQPPSVEDDPTVAIPPPIFIGLGIGAWSGSTCTLIAQRTDASLLTIISGTAMAGSFCVTVFDPGGDVITLPVNYQVEVDHY